jgi:hypothetical protein
MLREFHCIQDCSDCCINRQYYPSVDYGKIGVLLLPEEKKEIQNLAESYKLKICIYPRVGIGMNKKSDGPRQIIAYQLMGSNNNGDYCPFLDIKSNNFSHRVLIAQFIMKDSFLWAYPVIKKNNTCKT